MSSVSKNEVLSKRRSNKYVHSNPALQQDVIKGNPERPRASRIPRNPLRGEATQKPKVSACKQKSKDIFKYSESFDRETTEFDLQHSNSAPCKNDTNVTKGGLNKGTSYISNKHETTKDNKHSLLESDLGRKSQNIQQNECRTHQIGYPSRKASDTRFGRPDQDSNNGKKDQINTTNTVNDPQSPLNRSDQENIGDELRDTSQQDKNNHVEKNPGVIETVKQPLIPKNNLDQKKTQKHVSKNIPKALKVSDMSRKNTLKSSTSAADSTAQSRKLTKTGLSASEKTNTRKTKSEPHLVETKSKSEQNNRQAVTKFSKQEILKQSANVTTSKADSAGSRHFNVRSNERSKLRLSEQLLSKHNKAHTDEEKKLKQNNMSKSITSNTSVSSSHNGKVTCMTESETEPNLAKDIEKNVSNEACSKKISSARKKHVPIVTETKSSVLRRSRSRSITPGSSSVSSESSRSNSFKSSTSSKSCHSSGSPKEEKVRVLTKDRTSELPKSTKSQKNSQNGEKESMQPVKSYMRTTESAKNRGTVGTELKKGAATATTNRKQSVQSSKSESKQEIKSLSGSKGGACKISVNKSELCKPISREATRKSKLTTAAKSDVPLNSSSKGAYPTHAQIPFPSKDKQSELMTRKTGIQSDKLPIKHPITKSSTFVGNNTKIKETDSGKSSGVTTTENLKLVRRATSKCAPGCESSNEQVFSTYKSAKIHKSSAIKPVSCKNRNEENKSRLIESLPRNVSSRMSKLPKRSSRSLSNKSETSGDLTTVNQGINARDSKSKLQQNHTHKSSGRGINKKLLQANKIQNDLEINQTNIDSLCEEYSSDNYSCDNLEKILDLGKTSSRKEKQLSSKETDDRFCVGEYLEVKRELYCPENITLLHETLSENDDHCGSRKISEKSHFTGTLLKTRNVHVMKHTGDGFTVMNDKNSVSMETICASAPECSESHENEHSSVVKLDSLSCSLSCSVNDGRSVNRLETKERKMDSKIHSVISEQVSGNNVQKNMDRNVESRIIPADPCIKAYSSFPGGVNSNLDKCDNEIISTNEVDRKHDKPVTYYEAGDVCNVANDNPEIISDSLTSGRNVCMGNMIHNSNKQCDSSGICTLLNHDLQENNKSDNPIGKTISEENLEQTEHAKRRSSEQKYIKLERMYACPQKADDDRINSYMLIGVYDGSRHQWREHGCVSQQNDNDRDKDENIKFLNTGALGSIETDKRQNETQIVCSESILYQDRTTDKALSKHSTTLNSQTDDVLLHRNSCEQDTFNSHKIYHEYSHAKVSSDGFSRTNYKEIEQENIKNSCQTICEKSEVHGTFTSITMKQSDKEECNFNLCNKTVIPPEIQQSSSEKIDANSCENSFVREECHSFLSMEDITMREHHNTSCNDKIPVDRHYDKGSSEICEDESLSNFVSEQLEKNVIPEGQNISGDVKLINSFDNLALPSVEHNWSENSDRLAQHCVSHRVKNRIECQNCDGFKEHSNLQSREMLQTSFVSKTENSSKQLDKHLSEEYNILQCDKLEVHENSAKLDDSCNHANCTRRIELMQNEQNFLIYNQLCDKSTAGSKVPITESVPLNSMENTKIVKNTRLLDKRDCISETDANLCCNTEFCKERMQILNNSNIFTKKHEVGDSYSHIKLSKSENICNVVKTATQIQQTKCTPHAAGEHGKFQKTEFWDINSSLNQNQHLEYEFTQEKSVKPAQDFYHDDELKNSVRNERINETQGTICARNSISDFCLPQNNLCLCQNVINLEHECSSECNSEKRNEAVLKTSSCADYVMRHGKMELMQNEITPKIRETDSPTELKQGTMVTEMNIGLNSVDQKESVKYSNMEELALRPQECGNDQASFRSDPARDQCIPRDICLMHLPGSDNRQDLRAYNPNIHQDLTGDQMPGLSPFEFTSQDRDGYNQVFSEKATLPCDIPVINSTDQNLRHIPLTSVTDFEKGTYIKHSENISDIYGSKNNQEIIAECMCNLQTINSNKSGHVIKGSNFKASKTGNQFSIFDGKQPESFDSVLKDGDYHFNITERLDIQGSGGSEQCECSDTELTDLKSAPLIEPLDNDVVDGQLFTKPDKFGCEENQDGIKLCADIDLSSTEKDSTFFQILQDVSVIDNSITDSSKQCRIETNLKLDHWFVKEPNAKSLKEISESSILVGGTPQNNASKTASLTVDQPLKADNFDHFHKHQDTAENEEKGSEFPVKSKFIKSGSNSNIKQIATSCRDDSQEERSTESLTNHSLISTVGSNWGSIQVQNSTNQVHVNAGEALCDNVSDITDLFDDTGDDFVDAEETFDSELDTFDIEITNSSSCESDLNKQIDIQSERDFDDNTNEALSGTVTNLIPSAGGSNDSCTDIYKCRESLTSTESFQDAFDNFVEDTSNAISLQGDKTPENDDIIPQISSSFSRCSLKGVKDDRNVEIKDQTTIMSEGNSTLLQNPDDSMESRRRRKEVSTITAIVTGSSTVKHVNASEFRNTSAINDNAYQCKTPSSDLKETQHIVQTNVSRSSDKRNESEHGVIGNVIYNTGSSILPVDSCIPQTGQKEALCSQTSIKPVQSTYGTDYNNDGTESENQPVESIVKNDDSFRPTKDNISSVASADKIGKKIETAATIRTRRRRRRQAQQINTQSEVSSCSNSVLQERIDLGDLSGETLYSAGVNKMPKIESEESPLIDSRSGSVTLKNVSASVSESLIENKSCSSLSDSSVVLCSIENVPEGKDFDSTVLPDSLDSTFIDRQTTTGVSDNSLVLTQSENKLRACESSVNLSSVDTVHDETKFVADDQIENEPSNILCGNSVRSPRKESNSNDVRNDQPTFTVSVEKVRSHVNDNYFDDIEFIDADDIPEVQKECSSSIETTAAIDRNRKVEFPNASIIVTFEIASDEGTRNSDIYVTNESSSESDKVIVDQEDRKNIADQVNGPESILHVNRNHELLENAYTNVVIEDKVVENNDISVCMNSDLLSCETTEEQAPKSVVNLATDSETKADRNITGIEIQVRPLAESYTSASNEPENQEVHISNQEGELESVVSEESNISVAHALKLEREKLNELNNNCSNDEESGRSRSRTPGRRNIRSASTGNFILQLQKNETEEANTVLSSIKSGLSKRSIKKSSSFRIDRKNAYSAEDESDNDNDTMKNAGKKVSDICRSFVQKARSSSRPRADDENVMVKSPTPQRKLMKWVNDNGKWLRIPVHETIGDRKDIEAICQQNEGIVNAKHDACSKIQDKPNLEILSEKAPERCEDRIQENNTSNINVIITENTETTDSDQVVKTECSVHENLNDRNKKMIESSTFSKPSWTVSDNATDLSFVADTNKSNKVKLSQAEISQSPKILSSEQNVLCGQESANAENKDGLLVIEQSKPNQRSGDSKASSEEPVAVPSIACPPPTKLKPKLHLDIRKANEKHENDLTNLTRSYTAPVEIKHENSNDKESPKMNRSDFLLGIKDNVSRRKLVKLLSPTRSPQEPEFESGSVDQKTTSEETIPSPKRIPKLTAVKIQEEIFEGKPEYMKQCNIDLFGITEEPKIGNNIVSYFNSKRELRELKRSKTFTSMDDAKTGSKSHIFENKDSKETIPSENGQRESEMLQLPGGPNDDSDILTQVFERTTAGKSDKRKLKVPLLMRERSLQRPKVGLYFRYWT